jgi:hypothetical protein
MLTGMLMTFAPHLSLPRLPRLMEPERRWSVIADISHVVVVDVRAALDGWPAFWVTGHVEEAS